MISVRLAAATEAAEQQDDVPTKSSRLAQLRSPARLPSDKLFYFLFESIPEICAMGGITLEDFTQSRDYQEIFGLGEARGEARGKAREAAKVTLRLLARRCGPLSDATTSRIQALPLEQPEALAVDAVFSEGVALLDFAGPDDLEAWLSAPRQLTARRPGATS